MTIPGKSDRETVMEALLQRILGRLDPSTGCVADLDAASLGLDGAASNKIMERIEGYAMAAETLWNAYYGPGSNPESVEWFDVQQALAFAAAATGRGNPDFVPGADKALISIFNGSRCVETIDITDEVVRLDATSLVAMIADPTLCFDHPVLALKLDRSRLDELRLSSQKVSDFLGTEDPTDELMEAVRERYGIAESEKLVSIIDAIASLPGGPPAVTM